MGWMAGDWVEIKYIPSAWNNKSKYLQVGRASYVKRNSRGYGHKGAVSEGHQAEN